MGAINKQTGSFRGGLVVVGFSLVTSALLILALRKRIVPEMGAVAMTQGSPAVLPMTDIES
jgi:hypothetical protein